MLEITGVKILQDGEKVEISTVDRKEQKSASLEYHKKPHVDFTNAFNKLVPHFIAITHPEFEDSDTPEAAAFKDKFSVTSYSISGEDEKKKIVITAGKTVFHGYYGGNTPPIYFNAKPEKLYDGIDSLNDVLELIEKEATEYMEGRKQAPEDQLSLFEDDDTVTSAKIWEPESTLFNTPLNDGSGQTVTIPEANGEAMAEMAAEGKKSKGKKRVKQTAENKSGIVEE